MSANVWNGSAWAESETPKVYSGGSFVDSDGKCWENSTQKEAWGAFRPLVPVMTSNTAPYGEAIPYTNDVIETRYNSEAWKGFDGTATYYNQILNRYLYTTAPFNSSNTSNALAYRSPTKVAVKGFYLYHLVDPNWGIYKFFKSIKIQASDDGSSWTDIFSVDNFNINEVTYKFSNTTKYYYWRLRGQFESMQNSGTYIAILQFYY